MSTKYVLYFGNDMLLQVGEIEKKSSSSAQQKPSAGDQSSVISVLQQQIMELKVKTILTEWSYAYFILLISH